MADRDWSKINILIVEDSPTQALLLQSGLKKLGAEVSWSKNGEEGVKAVKAAPPTIVISDIEMPKMDGYQMCHQIKSDINFKHVPVILLTSLSDPADVIKGIECYADSFLTKPCDMFLLCENIWDVLETKKTTEKKAIPPVEIEFCYEGLMRKVTVGNAQMMNLLLSTYTCAIQKNKELEDANTELNRFHQELKKKNEELSALNDLKNQFLGMAAHDLRNPLAVIQGYSLFLLDIHSEQLDKNSIEMITHIRDSSSMMLTIINDLLDISVIESGKVQLNLKKVNFVSHVEHNLALKKLLKEQKQITLTFKHDEDIPEVTCDTNRIDQVINNLITNAIKFSYKGSTVEVTLTKGNNEVILSVKDQGVGIPANEKDRLFQPFKKTSAKSTAGESSTGLGLAIVKKIIVEHKGRIWVESEVGKGSTFSFAIPIGSEN